jgi:hypothetical protein
VLQYSGYYQAFTVALNFNNRPPELSHLALHRDALEPELKNWSEAKKYSLSEQFMTAMKVEYAALTEKGMFRHVPLNEPIRLGIKPIKTMW